jgi:hypothetical protein
MVAKSSRTSLSVKGALFGAAALILFGGDLSAPAQAQDFFGGFGGILRGFGGGGGGYYRGGGGYRHSYRSGTAAPANPGASNPAPSADDSSRALAALAPTSQAQLQVLKSVSYSSILGEVGSTEDETGVGKTTASGEAARDYTSKIEDLIKRIKATQKAQGSTKDGDISEHGILESLTAAYKAANLQRFETFLGENWSAERLRGMIIERASSEIGGLFDGTNRGAVSMSDLDTLIKKSALSVYTRLFETSELLAANRSSSLFVQRLYQVHGDLMNGEVREDAEQLLLRASSAGVAAFDPLLRRDPNGFALRYRAERIIFDCLSSNVEAISSSDSGIATPAEIEQRILDTDAKQCSKWVAAQLQSADGKVKAQEPMPLRAIWSEAGPKDDPSMYTRPADL